MTRSTGRICSKIWRASPSYVADRADWFAPAVFHDDLERGIPPEDRPADLPAIPLHLARDFQDSDVSDHVERAGKRSAERLRYVNDVFVAPDGHESLAEFPLFRWNVEIHPRRRRDE